MGLLNESIGIKDDFTVFSKRVSGIVYYCEHSRKIYGPCHKTLVPIAYARNHPLNDNADVSSQLGLSQFIYGPIFVHTRSAGSPGSTLLDNHPISIKRLCWLNNRSKRNDTFLYLIAYT